MPQPASPDPYKFLDWLALGHLANALVMVGAAVAANLHPRFHQSERMALAGAFLALACVILAVLDGWTALCLRRRQARSFCIGVSALNCLCLPGVLVGLPTLAALARPGVAKLFEEPPAPPLLDDPPES